MTELKYEFELNFITDGYGVEKINEPIGLDSVSFSLIQEDGRSGRDVSFAGGNDKSSRFSFTRMRHDIAFDKIQEYFENYGFESQVELSIKIGNQKHIIGELDFFTCENNQYDEFTCDVIQSSKQALLKRRAKQDVDLCSSETVDGDPIEPCRKYNYLLKTKDIVKSSEWDMGDQAQFFQTKDVYKSITAQVMPTTNIIKDGLNNTLNGSLTPMNEAWETRPSVLNKNNLVPLPNYAYLEADNNIKDLEINIDYNFFLEFTRSSGSVQVETNFSLRVYHYKNPVDGNFTDVVTYGIVSGNFTDITGGAANYADLYNLTIPVVNRFDRVVVVVEAYNRRTKVPVILTEKVGMQFNFVKMNIKMQGVTTDYSRRIKAIRLRDAVRYVCESTSGLEIESEILDNELFDQFIFDGNQIRNIEDRPFYLSFDRVLSILKETKIDYQVSENVIFYRDERYYSQHEIYVAQGVRTQDYKKTFNDKFAINLFKYKFEKFQSTKENIEENNYDIICGNINLRLRNKLVELVKEIEIGAVRDSFLIDETRRKSFRDDDDSIDEDNTKFLIDSLPFDNETIQDVLFLRHSVEGNSLVLENDGSFRWYDLGIVYLDSFIISEGSYNVGHYTVQTVNDNKLYLIPLTSLPQAFDNGLVTKVTYLPTGFDYKSRGDEGILTNNIYAPSSYANLNYSTKRNIVKHYNRYLSSCNIFRKNEPISVSYYQNNKEAETLIDELKIIEGEDFTPENPILNPYLHDVTIIIKDPNKYFKLERDLRDLGGFIRIVDGKGNVVRVYPKEMNYNLRDKACQIIGEEKFDNKEINIGYSGNGFFTFNDEYTSTSFVYTEKRNKISIFDDNKVLLYPATYWQKIAINGVFADSLIQLKEWMDSIS